MLLLVGAFLLIPIYITCWFVNVFMDWVDYMTWFMT